MNIGPPHKLGKIYMNLTNKRECVRKCVLESVFLTLLNKFIKSDTSHFTSRYTKNIILFNCNYFLIMYSKEHP